MLAIGKQLTAEQRIQKAVVKLMNDDRYIALASVLMIGDRTVRDDIPTACTNGRDEMYGRAFVDKLTDPELRGLIIHECKHKMYRHLITWKHLADIDPQLANMAMDYVINLEIVDENQDEFCKLPEGGLLDEKYRDMDTAQVFKALQQEQDNESSQSQTGEGQGHGSSGNTSGGFDEHDWEGSKSLTQDEQDALQREVDEAIRQGVLSASKMGKGGHNRNFDELLKPQINWRDALREFVTTTCRGNDYSTWRTPNRKYLPLRVYVPSGVSETVDELCIAIDTSGSISQRVLTKFMSEVKSACDVTKPNTVRILYWGSEVVRDEVYKQHEIPNILKATKVTDGGGTNAECVPEYLKANNITPQAVVNLTDGEVWGGWGKWSCPLLWCIIDNKYAKPDVGKVLHIKGGDV